MRQIRQHLGMPEVTVPGSPQRFLIDGRGGYGVQASGQRLLDSPFDELSGRRSARSLDLSPLQAMIHVREIDQSRLAARAELDPDSRRVHRSFEHPVITDDDGRYRRRNGLMCQRADDNFRTDAGGITDGDPDDGRIHRDHSTSVQQTCPA